MKYYLSHPNYLLKKHLLEVQGYSSNIIKNKYINYDLMNVSQPIIMEVISLTTLLHDSGKYSEYFQYYIRSQKEQTHNIYEESFSQELISEYNKNHKLKNHALLSAIILFTVLQRYFKWKGIDGDRLIYISLTAVICHHTNLKNNNFFKSYDIDTINNTIKTFEKTQTNEIYELIKNEFPDLFPNKEELQQFISLNIQQLKKRIEEENGVSADLFGSLLNMNRNIFEFMFTNEARENDFVLFIFMYSILIYSDKYSAIFKDHTLKEKYSDYSNFVELYKEKKGFQLDTELNIQRQKAYEEVTENIKDKNIIRNKLFTLTMNTGFGKTLTSFGFAMKLRDLLYKETNSIYKVIYCMPYTSIIEQNYDVVRKVLEIGTNKTVKENTLIKHHYLSKREYEGEEENYDTNKSRFLIETWNSEVVFTTFVQFFQTIFSNKNSMLVKFPNLINSIIVIDEVQCIDPELYQAFEQISQVLSSILNIYIISCSATQPYVHNTFGKELLSNYMDYYQTDRTQIIFPNDFFKYNTYLASKVSMEEFLDRTEEIVKKEDILGNKNLLIVMNTKKEAYKVYAHIKELYGDNAKLVLLSNSLAPVHKAIKIKYIQENMKNKNLIVVSTQLIEAGVDLDFDITIRNFALLPNLIQVVGRTNRNFRFKGNYGKMYVFNIENSCNLIYNTALLQYSFQSLEDIMDTNIILEKDYLKVNIAYFLKLKKYYSQEKGTVNYKNIKELNFANIDFKMIEEKLNMVSVFISYDDTAVKLWEDFLALPYDRLNRREEFEKIKADFLKYIIQISEKDLLKALKPYTTEIKFNEGIFKLDKDFCNINSGEDILYSYEIGFTPSTR